jgi:hypothetical protein
MTTTIVFAGTNDNYIRSQHPSSYDSALDGSNLSVGQVDGTTLIVGQAGEIGQTTNTYNSTWSASWNGFGKRSGTRAYQGNTLLGDGTGNQYGKIGFNDSAIRSDLTGATIDLVELRMSNEHSWFNAGLIGRFGTHNNANEPTGGSSTAGSFNRTQEDFNKGQTKWFTVPNAFGNELRDGTTRGITTGRTNAGNRNDYGYWRGWNSGASTRPQLRITFTAPGAGGFELWLSYIQFDYSQPSDLTPVSQYFRLTSAGVTGSDVERGISFQRYDWGTTVTTGDWRERSDLALAAEQNWVALMQNTHQAGSQTMRVGIERREEIDDPGTSNRYVLNTNRHRLGEQPDAEETNLIRSADTSGTSQDPALFVAQTTKHRLDMTLGGQVQLSDGTHIVLEQTVNAPATSGSLLVRHHDGTDLTTIDTISMGPTGRRGAQAHAICRDNDDSFYLIIRSDTESTTGTGSEAYRSINVRKFVKGEGHSWTVPTVRATTLGSYWGDINNIAAAWLPQGSGGTVVVLTSHMSARNFVREDQQYALLDGSAIASTGSIVKASGNLTPVFLNEGTSDGHWNPANETGSMLDVIRAGSSRGFTVGTGGHHVLGQANEAQIGRFTLASGGGSVSNSARRQDASSALCTKDGDAKVRAIPVDENTFVKVTADSRNDHGIVVRHLRNEGTSSTWTTLTEVMIGGESIASMPDASVLAISSAWDAVYSPIEHRVWVYYFDEADGRRLMRTHVDLNTGLAGATQVEVATDVGDSGSTNHAIRLHRGTTHGLRQLVTVANETSGGSHSLIYVGDNISIEPEQPTLAAKSNFNADFEAEFEWTFNHANPAATQGAFQLQIEDVDTETTVHDTAKVSDPSNNYTLAASSIDNGDDYRWRVRTWDDGDTEGPWSDYGFFSTSNTGIVNITDPVVDNDPSIIASNHLLLWDVIGPFDEFRVVVFRTDTEELHMDSDWVATETITQFLITEMQSGLEYRVEVTTRASEIPGNTAVRLITPEFSAPEVPILNAVLVHDGGFILLDIDNPDPQGDRPHPDANELFRREVGGTEPFRLIARLEPNEEYRDYDVRSNVQYEYIVRAGVLEED